MEAKVELTVTKGLENDHFAVQFKLDVSPAEQALIKRFHLWSSNLPTDKSGKHLDLQHFVQGVTLS